MDAGTLAMAAYKKNKSPMRVTLDSTGRYPCASARTGEQCVQQLLRLLRRIHAQFFAQTIAATRVGVEPFGTPPKRRGAREDALIECFTEIVVLQPTLIPD